MRLRSRTSYALLLTAGCALVASALWWHDVRTAGYAAVRTATLRVADAVQRGDAAQLTTEPLFAEHRGTPNWLLERRTTLRDGYRVEVQRNGDGGFRLLSLDLVTHLGVIRTPTGEMRLGFRYDPKSDRLEFVTASCTTPPAPL